jgi:ATP-dependent DNA helicase DinG
LDNRRKLPFNIEKSKSFYESLGDWIGDIFYDELPEKGFELRDEQIFMAFQLERAFKEKSVILAEAGVGTGKTLVYLLYSICYARYTGKPVIITCADESLIEQLMKPEGDIAKLNQALDLNIDARLAKSDEQYLCLKKLEKTVRTPIHKEGPLKEVYESGVPEFVYENTTMQSFYPYGDRKAYPHLNDEQWELINWDSYQDCSFCDMRNRCGKTLNREFTRNSTDLIICSHDYYMQHIWSYESRKREGQLPLLPEHAAVVFDEGHLLEIAAQKALTYKMKQHVLEETFERLLQNDTREEFAVLVEDIIQHIDIFFEQLEIDSSTVVGSDRMEIEMSSLLVEKAKTLKQYVVSLGDELVFESETYTLSQYDTRIIDEHLDVMTKALDILLSESNAIVWSNRDADGLTLVIMPRTVQEVLKENVFTKNIPYIFSSATLSEGGSFDYLTKSLGIKDYLSFTVNSPFNYEENMEVYIPNVETDEMKMNDLKLKLNDSEGSALILCNTKQEIADMKHSLTETPWKLLFEGEKEITTQVATFQQDERSVLCARTLWEGLDIPGPSLKNVIIFSLPFPPKDPVFEAKRKFSKDPYTEVDLPYMLLRLRQGIGRLIRSQSDTGSITILDKRLTEDGALFEKVKSVMPIGVTIHR